jgi:hypothetical protein
MGSKLEYVPVILSPLRYRLIIRSTSRKSVSLSSDSVFKARCECIKFKSETPGRTHTQLPAFAFNYAQRAASHDFISHSLAI